MSKVSIDAAKLRPWCAGKALALADRVLGPASAWAPSMIEYRLGSSHQRAWKVEVGSWLIQADLLGFLDALKKRLDRALHHAPATPQGAGANEAAHRMLQSELAPAMAVYYLTRSGWSFVEWEPPVASGDVDVRLKCPRGVLTDIQVKAPDQPGEVHDHHICDGEYDERVLCAIDKAFTQLEWAPGPQRMAILSPQRTLPVEARVLAKHLVGRTIGSVDGVVLRRSRRSVFAVTPGSRVGAVADLFLFLPVGEPLYRFTVFLNPWAVEGASPAAEAFRNARVCFLENGQFIWQPEAPERCYDLPPGTTYVDDGDGSVGA